MSSNKTGYLERQFVEWWGSSCIKNIDGHDLGPHRGHTLGTNYFVDINPKVYSFCGGSDRKINSEWYKFDYTTGKTFEQNWINTMARDHKRRPYIIIWSVGPCEIIMLTNKNIEHLFLKYGEIKIEKIKYLNRDMFEEFAQRLNHMAIKEEQKVLVIPPEPILHDKLFEGRNDFQVPTHVSRRNLI